MSLGVKTFDVISSRSRRPCGSSIDSKPCVRSSMRCHRDVSLLYSYSGMLAHEPQNRCQLRDTNLRSIAANSAQFADNGELLIAAH